MSVFDDPNIEEITAEDLGGDYPAIEYIPPHGRYSMDILARLGEAFRYEDHPLDPNNLRSVLSLMDVAYRLFPWRFPPGVHKLRSIEEANACRHEWESRMIRERRR